jgi:probable addiction module antidote protein
LTEASMPYEAIMLNRLQDDEYAIAYLNQALEDEEPTVFLLAIKRIAEARGIGMSKLSEDTRLNRRGLYKILSQEGNPEWATLKTLLNALGFGLSISSKSA